MSEIFTFLEDYEKQIKSTSSVFTEQDEEETTDTEEPEDTKGEEDMGDEEETEEDLVEVNLNEIDNKERLKLISVEIFTAHLCSNMY